MGRTIEEVRHAINCVRRVVRECGIGVGEFFRFALKGNSDEAIKDEIDAFESLSAEPTADELRHYKLPGKVYDSARTALRHAARQRVHAA